MKVVSQGLYVLGMRERIYADMANATVELGDLSTEVTHAWSEDQISDEAAQALLEEIAARRKRQREASDAAGRVGFHVKPRIKAKPDSDSGSAKVAPVETEFQAAERVRRKTRLMRRRYLSQVNSMPAILSQNFTVAELAVLSQISVRCRDHGRCDLTVASLSKRANVCERMVQNTIRKAERLRFVAVQYRRRLTNIVTVALEAWRDWWKRTPKAENEKRLFDLKFMDPLQGANTVPVTSQEPPKPVRSHDQVVTSAIANVVATIERKVATKPVAAKPRPKSVAQPSNLEQIAAAKALVEEVAKTRPVSDVDPWELPEPEGWMSLRDRSWLREWEIVEKLIPARYPQVFNDDGKSIRETVLNWLRDHWGSGGNQYGFHRFQQPRGKADTRIGFRSRRLAVEFAIKWRGV